MKFLNNAKIPFFLTLTLGLAPFLPEPHLWGKIKWIVGGSIGMTPLDWFDFILHVSPFIWLAVIGGTKLFKQK